MYKGILESFKQNPEALQRLLNTGEAVLTHVQDKTRWGNEFPKLLMRVRDELRSQTLDAPLTGTDLMSLYEQGNKRISEVLDQMEDLTADERQSYLNEFAQFMANENVNTQDKLEEAIRKFICNL